MTGFASSLNRTSYLGVAILANLIVILLGDLMTTTNEDKARAILEAGAPPEISKIKANDFVLEVQVDTTPQELRKLRSYEGMHSQMPYVLPDTGRAVLELLFSCFNKAGHVSEGLIGDLIWGFQQVTPPVPAEITVLGLRALESYGYVRFQARDGSLIGFDSDLIYGAFVRYTDKLLGLIYEGTA